MARLRRFGRAQSARAEGPDPWLDDPPPAPASRPVPPDGPGYPGQSGTDIPPEDPSAPGPFGRAEPTASPFGGRSTTPGAGAAPAGDAGPGPATRAARPVAWTPRRPEPDPGPTPDPEPVTDPFGFPPVPPVPGPDARDREPSHWAAWAPAAETVTPAGPGTAAAASPAGAGTGWGAAIPANGWAAWAAPDPADPAPAPGGTAPAEPPAPAATPDPPAPAVPSPRADRAGPDHAEPDRAPAPDPAEAAALAAAFAADYLSWDEDDPQRRGRVLAGYLPGPRTDRALLGWSGHGRQRSEMVLPGRVRPDGEGRVLVDVRVRVTPYRRVDQRGAARPEAEPEELLGDPAAAPPATARGWRGLASRWVRIGVSVALDGDDLIVDAGAAAPSAARDEPPPAADRGPARPDLTVDGDDDPPSPRTLAALRGGVR